MKPIDPKWTAQLPPLPTASKDPNTVAVTTIICAYVLAILIPLAGFFAGLWLCFKNKPGHGCSIMALSFFIAITFITLISMIH